jgi:excisionase family DNA binding protein
LFEGVQEVIFFMFQAGFSSVKLLWRGDTGAGVEELLTYEDVSRLTKFKISTLRKWVQLRKIPFSKINGSIRFNAEEIRAWAAGELAAGKGGGVAVKGAGGLFADAGEERS